MFLPGSAAVENVSRGPGRGDLFVHDRAELITQVLEAAVAKEEQAAEAVKLRYLVGLSMPEAAQALNLPSQYRPGSGCSRPTGSRPATG